MVVHSMKIYLISFLCDASWRPELKIQCRLISSFHPLVCVCVYGNGTDSYQLAKHFEQLCEKWNKKTNLFENFLQQKSSTTINHFLQLPKLFFTWLQHKLCSYLWDMANDEYRPSTIIPTMYQISPILVINFFKPNKKKTTASRWATIADGRSKISK